MLTIDEVKEILSDLIDELPEEIFKELNGGIALLPNEKLNNNARHGDLYIMGEYQVSSLTGRMIVIYYGSFERILGNSSREIWISRLREVLRHEFTHHVEILAGDRDLEKWDAKQIENYKRGIPMETTKVEK